MKRSNGEGTIYKRKDGRWCAAYYDSNDLRRHFVYGKTKAEVKERINEMKQDHQKTGANEVEYTLEDWVVFFLDNYKKNEVKQTTYDTYMGIYRRHVKNSSLGKLKLKRITSNDLQKFYNAKSIDGYNPKTVRRIYVIINSALKKAMQLRYVEENANQYVSLPKKIKYEAQVLSEESVRRIFSEAQNEVLYPIIVLTMCTGLRKGEVMALTWDNVNFQDRELYVEKNLCRVVKSVDENGKLIYENKILEPKTLKSKRTIPLIDKAVEVLNIQKQRQDQIKEKYAKFYNDNGLVFAEWDGGIIKQREFMNDFYAFLDKYNIPRVRFHDLRHTFASMLLNAGETPKAIQELLGHTTISTTMDIYTHITKQTKVNAIKTLELLIEDKE